MTSNEDLTIIRGILSSADTAIVTTRSHGQLVSRPLALQDQDEFEGTLWFLVEDPSPKTDDVRRHSEVNVAVADDKGYLSMSGNASIDRDQTRINYLWSPVTESFFDGKTAEDPSIALLRIDVETVEYWDLSKPAVAKAFEFVKGLVTKTEPELGENHTVAL